MGSSMGGFSSLCVAAEDREVVTVRDSQSMDGQSKRFLRARVVEP